MPQDELAPEGELMKVKLLIEVSVMHPKLVPGPCYRARVENWEDGPTCLATTEEQAIDLLKAELQTLGLEPAQGDD